MRLRSLIPLVLTIALAACSHDAARISAPMPGVSDQATHANALDPAFHMVARDWNVGEASACALSSGTLYCWGENQFGQHGVAGAQRSAPFAPSTVQLSFVEMSRGPSSQFYCGIKEDRSAVCWGRNGFGMLGHGVQGSFGQNPPASVAGNIAWAEITTGRLSACGVSTTNVGYCWGSNQRGEIGRAAVPLGGANAPDGGLTWRSVVAGWLHACGITSGRDVYCWGDNSRGQLGLGSIDNETTHRSPAPVAGGHKFIQLSLGAMHTCGVTLQHQVLCWGENFAGQAGNGSTTDAGTPTPIATRQRFYYVATSSGFAVGGNVLPPPGGGTGSIGHSCALTPSGEAWCWGWNAAGQLGDGGTTSSLVPVKVSGGLRFTSLSLGGTASCGRNGNRIWCWGGNQFGQLGLGSLINVSTPTLILSPFDMR
jgi:alpha-tubulin suppressor-like RCC1 family protein